MTDKQKQAIMVINTLFEHCGEKVFNYDDYFLLLDFIVGQQQVTYIPWTTEPKPITWEKPFWDDGITCSESTMTRQSATSGFMQPVIDKIWNEKSPFNLNRLHEVAKPETEEEKFEGFKRTLARIIRERESYLSDDNNLLELAAKELLNTLK